MHALVYTGTEKIVYREEKDPNKKPGEALIKVHASGICGQICMLTTAKMKEEFHHLY